MAMAINFEFTRPPAELGGLIKYFWVLEGTVSPGEPYHHRALVDGCAQMLFAFKGGFQRLEEDEAGPVLTSALACQTQHPRTYSLKEDFGLFGVCLYPFSIPYLFGVTGEELMDGFYSLDRFFGRLAKEMVTVIRDAPGNGARIEIASELIQKPKQVQVSPQPPVFDLIREIFQSGGSVAMQSLADKSGIPARHFQRNVKYYTGYTAKKLQRISRLQSTMQKTAPVSLAETAFEFSFYDQAHFTNEFRVLTGITPKEYYARKHRDALWRTVGREVAFFQS